MAADFGRLDTPDKVHAKAHYALDYNPEGALTALLTRSPKFGGKVASFDATAAKAVPGVTDIVQISNGVAVLATKLICGRRSDAATRLRACAA